MTTNAATSTNVEKPNAGKPNWVKTVAKYQHSILSTSLWQVATSIGPYALCWVAAYFALDISFWAALPFSILGGLFIMRIFIIQHDCGHNSFFKEKKWNNRLGFLCGVLTLTPYEYWRHGHAQHHATSGDLDFRGYGDVWTITANEYVNGSPMKRLGYRIYRHPLVMFLLGPAFVFVINQRTPVAIWRSPNKRATINMILTDLAILAFVICMIAIMGFQKWIAIHAIHAAVAGTLGVWLFYVQHNFEDTYWRYHPEWDYTEAALQGSSYYKLPALLQWFTGNIGLHHIHHLSPRIPNYLLQQCHDENPEFQDVPTLTLRTSLKIMTRGFALWDEKLQRMISFSEMREMYMTPKTQTAA